MNLRFVVSCLLRNRALRLSAHTAMTLALLVSLATTSIAGDPADWNHWRGPQWNGISPDKNLPSTWSPKGENVIWSNDDYGTRCTPVVLNDKIYVVARYKAETTEEGERLICINADTGAKIWEKSHNIFLSDAPAERTGWSSAYADPSTGDVFWLGLGCEFLCLDGETGETKWAHALSEEYGMLSTYGGRTNFPIVFEDLVIVSGVMTHWGETAVPAHRFIGFDKRTGGAVWFSSTTPKPKDTTYSSPFLTTIDGQAAIVFGAGDGKIHAMQPRTGKLIWSYLASGRGIWTSPVVVDNIVYGGFHELSAKNTRIRGGLFAFDARQTGEITEDDLLWKIDGAEIEKGQPIVVDGRLYVVDLFGELLIVDAKTGEKINKKKVKVGRKSGVLVYGDGKLYCAELSMFSILKPSEDGVELLERIRPAKGDAFMAAPIINKGKLYVTTSERIYCIGDTSVELASDPLPELPGETPKSEDTEIAHIQVAPVEVMLAPGQSTPYQVRAYNKNGQFLKVVDAEFSVEGGGEISADGNYTAPATADHVAVFITAKAGGVTSTARARVIPPLPWSFDFSDKKVPITWVGASYRQQPKDLSGEQVLVKVSTIPLGTRSQSWMGWTTLSDYTIQADLYSTNNPDNGERADMGVINQRYTLDLMHKDQLQIRSWTPRLENRFAKTIPFVWEGDTWYTLKFQSENADGKAVLRGKVWKRGEEEPADWMIEAADAVPNTSGSPGLFGKSDLAEFYIDNVKVYKNN